MIVEILAGRGAGGERLGRRQPWADVRHPPHQASMHISVGISAHPVGVAGHRSVFAAFSQRCAGRSCRTRICVGPRLASSRPGDALVGGGWHADVLQHGGLSGRMRRLTVAAALVVAAPVVSVVAGAQPAVAAVAAPIVDCPVSQVDERAAAASARACRGRVEVSSKTSPTLRVFAEPNGTFTAQLTGDVARVPDGQGGWAEVDLTLAKRPDGSVAPRVHPNGLVLAGCGRVPGSMTWPWLAPATTGWRWVGGDRCRSRCWTGRGRRMWMSSRVSTWSSR